MQNKKLKQQQPENKRDLNGLSFRESVIEVREEEGKAPVVRMSVSSETPVLTYVRIGDDYIRAYEILDHNESSIDRSRCSDGLVIQDTHYGDQIGLIRAPIISDKKLGGIVEFCAGERAKEIGLDAANGLRKNTSVGYRCDPEKYVVEGQKDGYPVVRSLSWCPHEASFVNVPADTSVGVGRALEETQTPQNEGEGKRIMTPKEMAELFKRAALFGIEADAVQALIDKDQGRAELDALIVERQASQITELRQPKKEDPTQNQRKQVVTATPSAVPEKEMRKYSLVNVCRAFAGDSVDIGREREISQECEKVHGKATRGMIIPFEALSNRAFSVAGTSSATVATDLMASNFVDLLRAKYTLGQLGVQFWPGMVGKVEIPKMTGGATCYHVAEGGVITDSTPTLAPVAGDAHTIGALVDITRRMMEQSTPDAEGMVRNEILNRIMLGVQTDVFAGTGDDGQPSAITTATGINNPAVTQGTPTYTEILSFVEKIESANAAADGQKWLMTGEVMTKLASTMRNATYGEKPILDPDTTVMFGRPWFTSEGIPANSLWFGDWSKVIIPMWGAGVEIASDTAKLFSSGGITLRALLDFDVMVTQGAALSYNTAVTN